MPSGITSLFTARCDGAVKICRQLVYNDAPSHLCRRLTGRSRRSRASFPPFTRGGPVYQDHLGVSDCPIGVTQTGGSPPSVPLRVWLRVDVFHISPGPLTQTGVSRNSRVNLTTFLPLKHLCMNFSCFWHKRADPLTRPGGLWACNIPGHFLALSLGAY